MKLPLSVLLLASAYLAGCSSGKTYESIYILTIDPEFTPDEVTEIIKAAEAWESVVPVTFASQVGSCSEPIKYEICIRKSMNTDTTYGPNEDYNLDGMTVPDGDRGQIFLYPHASSTPEMFYLCAEHELGHAQGLVHHNGCNIMTGVYSTCTQTPSADDVVQWKSISREGRAF